MRAGKDQPAVVAQGFQASKVVGASGQTAFKAVGNVFANNGIKHGVNSAG
jgi:hypothetical protein